MAAAIFMEAFDAVIPRLPVNRCLDRKRPRVKVFKVILFFPTILRKEGLERSHRSCDTSLHFFMKKKAVFFFSNSGGTNFAHVNAAKTIAYLIVIFPLLLKNFFGCLEGVKLSSW